MPVERISILCFAASYAVALGLELLQLLRPHGVQRWLGTAFASAGLLAHSLFLVVQRPSLATQFGSLVFLGWILAVFYLYGSVHHRRLSWGVFVLPVVLGLTLLAGAFGADHNSDPTTRDSPLFDLARGWNLLHIALFLLGAVGVCVAFTASLMYLVQAQRLKAKAPPGQGLRLLSLERLEMMNRRGINAAFPLLTFGLLIGMVQLLQADTRLQGWTDPRILSALTLWLVFAIVLYLRYGYHLRGRRVAFLTIMAFALLLVTLLTSHNFGAGGGP